MDCDLLIVMGTSLTVHPFAGLKDLVNDTCVRLLINREEVGKIDKSPMAMFIARMQGLKSNSGMQ